MSHYDLIELAVFVGIVTGWTVRWLYDRAVAREQRHRLSLPPRDRFPRVLR